MRSVLVVGGSGYLGQSLGRTLGSRGISTYNSKPVPNGLHFDASETRLRDLISEMSIEPSHAVVTYGAINPEFCARDPVGSAQINVHSVIEAMRDAIDAGIVPVFLSTDYVFDGTRGARNETESTCPTTQYGAQKVAVEEWLHNQNAPWIIARASKLVSGARDTHSVLGQWVNDIQDGREMRCATDQVFSPALVDDVARSIVQLIDHAAIGIFHVAGDEAMSRYDLAKTLVETVEDLTPTLSINLTAAKIHDFPFLEKRPLDTSLDTAKLRALDITSFRSMKDLCTDIAREHFS
ncbi:MAG: sugar nucleotide-binding protein [Parvibaculum sp.]|nr:sugar nucleotide-binding protein [Parvibaculum sp.]|tara:strand:- start:30357 stop:31238 length:882 start_codon:yes stop_codon:yes gene_type:complete